MSDLADPMEAWKARGRELNALYDVLTEIVEEPAPGFDPVADLKALGAQRDRMRAAISEAAGILSMTQCPYYQREEKCDRGCHSEPACQTDTPAGGWEKAALDLLNGSLGSRDSQAPKEATDGR